MKEIVSLHIGQAGIKAGNSCWEIFCLEHGIQPDGMLSSDTSLGVAQNASGTFFSESTDGKHVARAVFVDVEPSAIDEVRNGTSRQIFDPDLCINGNQDSSITFARGNYNCMEIADLCLERARKLAENCDHLQGFFVYNVVGGGTGSGLGSFVLQQLSQYFGIKPKIAFSIYPSSQDSTATVEPYNSILSTREMIEHADATIILDNEAIYDICQRSLDIEKPTHTNLNNLISQVISSSITTPLRFKGSINGDLTKFQTNLIPYPRVSFLLSAYAPVISINKAYSKEEISVPEITNAVIHPRSMMAKCNPGHGRYISSCLMYQGDVRAEDVYNAVDNIKSSPTVRFVDCCPTSFKCGIDNRPPSMLLGGDLAKVHQTVCMISNNIAVEEVFSRINKKFDQMMKDSAFLDWYEKEGMQKGELCEARDDLRALELDYEEVRGL